jgi:RNA polymerase sigma-70 factor (ECF subfamily)
MLNREHGLSYREVAETLDISVKTVEVHMGRALGALRRQLADWIE